MSLLPAPQEPSFQVDCRGRQAKDVLREAIPACRQAQSTGVTPRIEIKNLQGLNDSVSVLLKAFDRLAADFGARITIADSSGFGEAFLRALKGDGHLDLAGDSKT